MLTCFHFFSLLDVALQYCRVLLFTGQKLDDDKHDTIPEVFIDQDEVLVKVCTFG